MSTNLGIAASFSEWAFVDVFKLSSPWVSGTPWGDGREPVWNDGRPLDLDDHGWVRSLLPDQIARTAMLTGPLPTRPAGTYVVLYDGDGELSYTGGATLIESNPGRDVIEVVSTGEIALNVMAVNPDDYIRNIRVIMPGGVYRDDPTTLVLEPDGDNPDFLSFEEHHGTVIFHPDFLESIEPYGSIRFMNWMLTNGASVSDWGDRPLPDDARWTIDGVPLEMMIELANRTATDPWFTLPHLADDEFVQLFARMVDEQLDPGLTPYVEYSNEVWNTQFDQHDFARAMGVAQDLDNDPFTAAVEFYGARAAEVFDLWADELVERPFVAVVGTKTSDPRGVTRVLLENAALADQADALAVAGYFGIRANRPAWCDDIASMTLDEFFIWLEDEAQRAVDGIATQAELAAEFGLDLVVYEGGQHLRRNGCSGDTDKQDQIGHLFDAANRDSRMRDVYLGFFADVEGAGVTLFSHYVNTGAWTAFGRFGAREHLGQTPDEMPKYDAIISYAAGG